MVAESSIKDIAGSTSTEAIAKDEVRIGNMGDGGII